ncbi:hypothetical protein K488DRAFT_38964, partial [Vararia minispora EC-137]
PISLIPVEVISSIFLAFAEITDTLFNLKWVPLMLVCRRWHDVAIGTHALWSFV